MATSASMPAAEDWPAISSSKYGGTVEYEIWPTFHIVVTTGDRVDVFLCILEHNRALGRILCVKRHEWLSCRTRMITIVEAKCSGKPTSRKVSIYVPKVPAYGALLVPEA